MSKNVKNRNFQVLTQASWGAQTRAMGMILDAKSISIQIFGSRALNSSVLKIGILAQREPLYVKRKENAKCQKMSKIEMFKF